MVPSMLAATLTLPPLTALAVQHAGPGYAVSPPPIDASLLPGPAAPAPPQPTVQREVCTVLATDPQRTGVPGQLDSLGLPSVWQLTRGEGQRVAIIDTGVSSHRRLRHLIAGGDYVSTGDGTQDCDGHGTAVAGIVAGAPDSADGFAGVAPEATVIGIRQSSSRFGVLTDPSGIGVGDISTMALAVRTAADLGASVINISSVACVATDSELDDRALGAALAYAVDVKDTVVVAAAGDTTGAARCPTQPGAATPETAAVAVSPAWYNDYVLTVASVTGDGAPSAFTLPGPWVGVAAPGEAVTSLGSVGDALVNAAGGQAGPGDTGQIWGTSYAAPVVSGLAALIRSRFPALTARQVTARIKATAHHRAQGWDRLVGNGVIDAAAAVSAEAPSTPPTPRPGRVLTPAVSPPASTPPDRRADRTAMIGAAACLVVLLPAVLTGRRRPGRRHDIPSG
jgi:membrane-anchored mycosin MYCP